MVTIALSFFVLQTLISGVFVDNNFAYDPSGCTAVVALLTDDDHIFVVSTHIYFRLGSLLTWIVLGQCWRFSRCN